MYQFDRPSPATIAAISTPRNNVPISARLNDSSNGCGATQPLAPATSFLVDAEAGLVTFGDGLAGKRPGAGERLYARYDYSEGQEGNVGPNAIKAGPLAPQGFTATNPIATWGGM